MTSFPANVAKTAFASIAAGECDVAAALWSAAPTNFAAPELIIAAINNAAVAQLLQDNRTAAAALLRRNTSLGDAVQQMAGRREANVPGSSTGFHIRLAAKHAPSFSRAADGRTRTLTTAILAVLAHHSCIAEAAAPDDPDPTGLRRALRDACGPASPEVATLDARTMAEWRNGCRARADRLNELLTLDRTGGRVQLELALAAMALLPAAVFGRVQPVAPEHAKKEMHAG